MTDDSRFASLPINRRSLIAVATSLFGAALVPGVAQALVRGGGRGLELARPFFSTAERALVSAASERIMPTTDTPGAIAAGVPEFIEMMLGEWYLPADRDRIMTGIRALDAFAVRTGRRPFALQSVRAQNAILTRVMRDKVIATEAGDGFFEEFRQLVVTGYYRSEIGVNQEQVYLPIPGHYDGSYPYSEVNRIITL